MSRPKEFKVEEALAKATQAFLEGGYEGTSLQDLCEKTGVQKASLYGTFGDKRHLFLLALDTYRTEAVDRLRECLEKAESPRQGLKQVLLDAVQPRGCAGAQGCLCVNTAIELAPHDAEIRERLTDHMSKVRALFAATLERGKSLGEWPESLDSEYTAGALQLVKLGLLVASRAGCHQRLSELTERMLDQLLA